MEMELPQVSAVIQIYLQFVKPQEKGDKSFGSIKVMLLTSSANN